MKQFTLLFLLSFSSYFATAQVYVNSAATGMNNGTSWANAYQSLSAAMKATTTVGTQIWVAKGTYKPDTTAGLPMSPGVQLYGGFAGTETTLSQRNPVTNVTILSGDLGSNDVAGNFTTNRTDNALHVIWLRGADTTSRAIIDGFAVRGGQTKATNATTPDVGRGGGILAMAKVTIQNCVFADNGGFNGAAIAASGAGASGMMVRSCTFDGNFTGERSLVYYQGLRNGEIRRCTFNNNTTARGSFMADGSRNITVDSCTFTRNRTTGTLLCPGAYALSSTANITNCVFTDNKAAGSCGAIWLNANNVANVPMRVANCTFERDTSLGFGGGAIYASSLAVATIENCSFKENRTASGGGAIFAGFAANLTIRKCNFSKNTSSSSAGGIFLQNVNTAALVEDSQFSENQANSGTGGFGGAILCGFLSQITLNRCDFTKNQSAGFGGVMQLQSDSSKAIINNCTFTENSAAGAGGVIHQTGGPDLEINQSSFVGNSGDFGGVLALRGAAIDPSVAKIDRCIFRENNAASQGGALDIQNAIDTRITNCLITGNVGENGAAISNNASGGDTTRLTIIHCTIADNISGTVGGIVQYEDTIGSKAILTLQNTILYGTFGPNYLIENGTPTVLSLGGNLCSDMTMTDDLKGTNDLNDADPMLSATLQLSPGSPCINKGTAAAGITTDLTGAARDANPDMGCYEFGVVGTFETPKALHIDLSPNPVADLVRIGIENDQEGTVLVDFFDATGRNVISTVSEKSAGAWQLQQSVANWPAGRYQVRVRIADTLYGGTLVKQ